MTQFYSILFSGILGVIISSVMYNRHDRYLRKLDVARRLFRHRSNVLSDGFMEALNEVFVVFHKSEDVLKHLVNFHTLVTTKIILAETANQNMLELWKAICCEIKIKPDIVHDKFFIKPFSAPKKP